MSASLSEPVQTKIIKHDDFKSHENPDIALLTSWTVTRFDKETHEKIVEKHTLKLLTTKTVLNALPPHDMTKNTAIGQMLSPRWASSTKTSFNLPGNNGHGWKLLLDIFSSDSPAEIKSSVVHASLETFWHCAVVCDEWNVNATDARVIAHFDSWYQAHSKERSSDGASKRAFARSLLWPTWYFENSVGFQWATKFLIYNDIGHIEPYNPTKYREIIMPKRVVHMLNSAKARVRYVLLQELYTVIRPFLKKGLCPHAATTVFGFMVELEELKASFLDIQAPGTSANELIGRLEDFDFDSTEACQSHRPCVALEPLEHKVRAAIGKVKIYIDGLCLNCINHPTKSKHNLSDCPYGFDWRDHVDACGFSDWDSGCGIDHGQPTWYFSSTASEFNHKRLYNE